jgi:hypothetical protein
MPPRGYQKRTDYEFQILRALYSLKNGDSSSIREAARDFEVSRDTLSRRLRGGVSQPRAHEMAQILTNAEENTLVRWIKQSSKNGVYILPTTLIELAQHIRAARVTHASSRQPLQVKIKKINHKWI